MRVLGCGEGVEDGCELRGDLAVGTRQMVLEAPRQQAPGAETFGVEASAGSAAGAQVGVRDSGAGPADRGAIAGAGDQRPGRAALRAVGGMAQDPHVAAGTGRADGPAGLNSPEPAAAGAGFGAVRAAGPADKAVDGMVVARLDLLADRAGGGREQAAAV